MESADPNHEGMKGPRVLRSTFLGGAGPNHEGMEGPRVLRDPFLEGADHFRGHFRGYDTT